MRKSAAKQRTSGAAAFGHWLDLRKRQPEAGARVLVCDDDGYISIEDVEDVVNDYAGKRTWLEAWECGNGTKLVAWMPIPGRPKRLCNKNAWRLGV